MSVAQITDPIRVLLFTTELRPGGAEKCLTQLACNLDPKRFSPVVATLGPAPDPDNDQLVQMLTQHEIPIHFLNCSSKWSFLSAIKNLAQLIRTEKISLVKSFLFHANVVAGLAVGRVNRSKQESVKLLTGIRVAEPSRIRHWIERWATKNADGAICVSPSVSRFALETMRLPIRPIFTICNGVELPPQKPKIEIAPGDNEPVESGRLPHWPTQKPAAVFVGRFHQQKGLVPFLSQFAQSELKNELALILVGDGPERSRLETIVATHNLQHVHFVGWQASPGQWISQADLTILPSLYEGMPNVLLETMVQGKPFVAFDVDGVADLQIDSEVQVIPQEKYQTFFDSMSQLVRDKALASQLGKANRIQVESNFTLEKMIAEFETAFLTTSGFAG